MRTARSPHVRRLRPALIAGAALLVTGLLAAAPARGAGPPPDPGAIEGLWSRGEAAFKAGDLNEALRLFGAALAGDERRARSWNYVGGVLFAQGDLSGALADFRKALELDPRDVRACNNLGTALERLGDYAGAAAAYAQAELIDPAYPPTQRNLGILMSRRMGNPDAARRAWQRYLALAPAGETADEVRRELADLAADALVPAAPAPVLPAPAPAVPAPAPAAPPAR